MPDLAGKTIFVTGATDGLGRGVAGELAARGAEVLVHGRDPEKVDATIAELRDRSGNQSQRGYLADMSSLQEVRRLAAELDRSEQRLDVLVNNAGIGSSTRGEERREESADGYELRFAVNYLSQFLLTNLLLPLLRRSAPARIVNVASIGQAPIDFDDVMLERGYSGVRAYAQSKLAQVAFTFDLADRLPPEEVTANCLHPATYMPTKMVTEAGRNPFSELSEGVDATVRLVADPDLAGVSGRYFDGLEESSANPQAYDDGVRRRLRELSERLTGL
jgi:NAD(P)-dependent dehydrogenase (short-subunit alcohol dehydrogenase family)